MNGVRDPYPTCDECLVKDWCGRRNGTSPLPIDYDVNPECGGYVMLEQAFRLSGIPAEFRNANRRNFQYDQDNISYKDYLEDTFDRIVDFVDKGTNIAFIHPNKGTGKTHTVCTIANEYIFRACIGLTPEFWTVFLLISLYLKTTFFFVSFCPFEIIAIASIPSRVKATPDYRRP